MVDSRLPGAHLVRLYVDDVVLLQIVCGRLENVGRTEIQLIGISLSVFFADYEYVVAFSEDGQIAGHGNGFEHSHFIALYGVCAGLGDFADKRHFEVHEVDGHDTVFQKSFFCKNGGNLFLKLPAVEAACLDFAKLRKVDESFVVDYIADLVVLR